jgi:hypothetical protein
MGRPTRKAARMSEWVLHCEVKQRHIRRSQPTRDAVLKDACSQLLQGYSVNRIVGPNVGAPAARPVFALEDATDIDADLAIHIRHTRSIAHQSTCFDVTTPSTATSIASSRGRADHRRGSQTAQEAASETQG